MTPLARLVPARLASLLLVPLLSFGLSACGGDGSSDSDDTAAVEQPSTSPYLSAQTGDVLKVTIAELHPTQPAIGFDQIYYHLARKQPDLTRFEASAEGYLGDDDNDNYSRYLYRSERKRVDDYCADNGQGGIDDSRYVPGQPKLNDPSTYACSASEPTSGSEAAQELKTVVVGPGGQLYLTDGHHTFTVLKELADGGDALPVWVRVSANYSDAANDDAFWQRMEDSQYVWLRDVENRPITPDQLPQHLGLDSMSDDPYRSLVYLTRDMGYSNANVSEFAEFNWGVWLREKAGLSLSNYDLKSLDKARITLVDGQPVANSKDSSTSYVAAVRDAAIKMVALADTDIVANDRTAAELGKLAAPTDKDTWNDLMEDDIWRADLSSKGKYRTAGKAWYALKYQTCGGAANTQPACWSATSEE